MNTFTFPKSCRLLKGSEFNAVKGTRLKISSPHILLLAQYNKLSEPRLGLAIAKKHLKRAVARNLVKRVARESFRYHRHLLPSVDVIVLARSAIGELDSKELHQCLEKSWKQLIKRAKPS